MDKYYSLDTQSNLVSVCVHMTLLCVPKDGSDLIVIPFFAGFMM